MKHPIIQEVETIAYALESGDHSGIPESRLEYRSDTRSFPEDHRFLVQGRSCGEWLDSRFSAKTLREALELECQIMENNWPGRVVDSPGPGRTRVVRIRGRGVK